MPDLITINGKSIGFGETAGISLFIARLPTHTIIDLPVHVFRGPQDGPVLLLTAGLHGDEINGIEIIRRLIVNRDLVPRRGTVIAVPIVNVFGFIHFSRDLPDGKDLNRSFPGRKDGSLARRIAYVLMEEILPQVDYGVDFHTGGASRTNYPQIRCFFDDPQSLKLAESFAPPVIVNARLIDHSFRHAAFKRGKHIIVYEGGETLRFDEFAIRQGMDGVINLMHTLEMAANPRKKGRKKGQSVSQHTREGDRAFLSTHEKGTERFSEHPRKGQSVFLERTSWIRARRAGIFRSYVPCGERVKKRQVIGIITDPYGESEVKIKATTSGHVIGLNNLPVINRGDALFHIGVEFQS